MTICKKTWLTIVTILVALAFAIPTFAATDPVIVLNAINSQEARKDPSCFNVDNVHLQQLVSAMRPYGLKPGSLKQITSDTVGYLPMADGYFVFGKCFNANPYRCDALDTYPGYLRCYEGGWFAHFQLGEHGNHITFFGRLPQPGPPGPAGTPGQPGPCGERGEPGPCVLPPTSQPCQPILSLHLGGNPNHTTNVFPGSSQETGGSYGFGILPQPTPPATPKSPYCPPGTPNPQPPVPPPASPPIPAPGSPPSPPVPSPPVPGA